MKKKKITEKKSIGKKNSTVFRITKTFNNNLFFIFYYFVHAGYLLIELNPLTLIRNKI